MQRKHHYWSSCGTIFTDQHPNVGGTFRCAREKNHTGRCENQTGTMSWVAGKGGAA